MRNEMFRFINKYFGVCVRIFLGAEMRLSVEDGLLKLKSSFNIKLVTAF